ncbi:MAG: hypothetical protein Q8P33_01310 [bacterium]|nr:hypothetical protein [bacterium]
MADHKRGLDMHEGQRVRPKGDRLDKLSFGNSIKNVLAVIESKKERGFGQESIRRQSSFRPHPLSKLISCTYCNRMNLERRSQWKYVPLAKKLADRQGIIVE